MPITSNTAVKLAVSGRSQLNSKAMAIAQNATSTAGLTHRGTLSRLKRHRFAPPVDPPRDPMTEG
jgi:hypothetical protein